MNPLGTRVARGPSRMIAYTCLALSMSLVGTYMALIKPLAVVLPVFLLAWLRFGIGGIAMLRWIRKPADEPSLSRKVKGLIFLESFLGNFLFTLCMIMGISMTTAVSAGVIMASIPAMVAILSWVFLKEHINLRVWLAAVCCAVGIGLLSLAQPTGADAVSAGISDRVWLGNLLVFGAVICEAAYAVIGKSLTATLSPKRISAVINLWGLILMTPFGLYTAWGFDFVAVPWSMWLLLLFYGLAASVWTVWLWMTGLSTVQASRAGMFTVMLPISAAVVGVLVLGESLGPQELFAFAIALAGLLLATAPTKAKDSRI